MSSEKYLRELLQQVNNDLAVVCRQDIPDYDQLTSLFTAKFLLLDMIKDAKLRAASDSFERMEDDVESMKTIA